MKELLYVCLLFLLAGCNPDEGENEVLLPRNLQVELEQSADNPARVTLNMSAENTNFYKVDFGDGSQVPDNFNGELTYTYPAPGSYVITVQAHATVTAFISETREVVVPEPAVQDIIPADGYTSPLSYEGMTLVWQDEFSGTTLNTDDWFYLMGDGCPDLCGWGNNELQFYTQENTEVRDGHLIITAKNESRGGKNYTSSRISTKNKESFRYGRIDIRAALPKGQGIWPALWMLGQNIEEVGWPACGEIDIMEMIGGSQNGRDNTVHGTLHWFEDAYANFGKSYSLPAGETFNGEFHVFTIVWDDKAIRWLVDDQEYNIIDISGEKLSEFRQEFYFLFNVAVGGNWPGSPDATTTFPQHLVVDYVRVFQDN